MAELADLFRGLADPTRLRILALLRQGEVCVCHIYESLGIPQSKASRHLGYLRRLGLVEDRKRGLWVYYRLAEPEAGPPGKVLAALAESLAGLEVVRADCCRLSDALQRIGPDRPPANESAS